MIKYLGEYAATTVVMVALDLLWLGVIAKPLYQQGIGHLMADQPNLVVAALFYVLFPVGLMIFAVMPTGLTSGWGKTITAAALFGFFTYATYDLTNLATLKNWPVALAFVDVTWGVVVSAVSAAAGKIALDRLTAI